MKRGLFMLSVFLVITLFTIIPNLISAIDEKGTRVTGKIITGDATQTVSMNISVTAYFPLLSIISPKNNTYLVNESLLLNYSVSNQNTVWYNLDNSPNITITSLVYFNTSQGSHTLYLYANSSFGNITIKNVTFFINSSRFIIVDGEYNGSTKGSSTDFKTYSYEELQNLSNIIIENTQSGKILFNQVVNLTDDESPDNNLLNMDTNINISFNKIEINSTALPNFNRTATLQLYNLTFSNPRILKNGEICPSSICIRESYSNRLLKFNVTGFSVYSAEETPATETPSAGGGGAGGGGITSRKLGFETTPELIEVMIKKGESFKFSIKIKNNGISTREFKAEVLYLQDSVSIQNPEFSLGPGEEKEVILIFSPADSLKEDTYTGKIKISSEGQEKEIPIILSLKSKIVLFDLTLNIPSNYKEVRPGGDVLFQVSLFNLGGGGKADVELTYYVKDFEGNIIVEQKGIVGVETQASFSRTIKLPEDMAEGQYTVGANARYDNSIGTSSDVFYVNKLEISLIKKFIPVTIIFLISLIVLVILLIVYFKRKIKRVSKTYGEELNRVEERIKKGNLKSTEVTRERLRLKRALEMVEKAYEKGYITKQSYEAGKLKIKRADENLKKEYL